MSENTPIQPPVKDNIFKKLLSLFKPGQLVALGIIVLCLIVLFFVVSNFGKKTTQSLVASYQLYSQGDAKQTVLLFFGNPKTEGFKTVPAIIYDSVLQINRIKQLLMLLTDGPKNNAAVNLLPQGTTLKDAYIDANSILYIDMSPEYAANCKGGTTGEYEAIYSIINTVLYNFPWINGVKFVINGTEKETLAGHISIKSIMTADMDLSNYK